jgi:2-keto-3-deoxy-L-fuconate dehydrogenase
MTENAAVAAGRAGEFGGLVAAVTGGASGIGLATAEELALRGAEVCVLDLNTGSLPAGLHGFVCDVTDRASVNAALAAVGERFGRLDVLVNNAGIGAQGTVEDNDDAEWARVLDVNVTGAARVSAAALPLLRQGAAATPGSTAIVNTCSIAASAGLPQRALYSASKGAILALTRAMAADHIREGIRVNCVNPGTVDTPWIGRLLAAAPDPAAERAALAARQPTGRLVSAQEVAAAVCYLAGPYAGATTGTDLAVDGGMQGLRLRPAEPAPEKDER